MLVVNVSSRPLKLRSTKIHFAYIPKWNTIFVWETTFQIQISGQYAIWHVNYSEQIVYSIKECCLLFMSTSLSSALFFYLFARYDVNWKSHNNERWTESCKSFFNIRHDYSESPDEYLDKLSDLISKLIHYEWIFHINSFRRIIKYLFPKWILSIFFLKRFVTKWFLQKKRSLILISFFCVFFFLLVDLIFISLFYQNVYVTEF